MAKGEGVVKFFSYSYEVDVALTQNLDLSIFDIPLDYGKAGNRSHDSLHSKRNDENSSFDATSIHTFVWKRAYHIFNLKCGHVSKDGYEVWT